MSIVWQRIKPQGAQFHGRVATDPKDIGYNNFSSLIGDYKITVLLNGVEQDNCEMADPIEGVVLRCKIDNRGEIYIVGDEIAKEVVTGNVQILLSK